MDESEILANYDTLVADGQTTWAQIIAEHDGEDGWESIVVHAKASATKKATAKENAKAAPTEHAKATPPVKAPAKKTPAKH